jgi:hypothetical protein
MVRKRKFYSEFSLLPVCPSAYTDSIMQEGENIRENLNVVAGFGLLKLENEFHTSFLQSNTSPRINIIIEPTRMGWTGDVARIGYWLESEEERVR